MGQIMNNIYENRIPKEDYSRSELVKYSYILSDDIYKYLLSVLNMEISPLETDSTGMKEYGNFKILKAINTLTEIKLYRDIIAFNLYSRANRYIDTNDRHFKLIDSPFKDGVNAIFKNEQKEEFVIYSFNYGFDNHCTINLFDGSIQSVSERAKDIKIEVDKILKDIDKGFKVYGASRFANTSKYFLLKNDLEMYENITLDELKNEYENDKIVSEVKKKTLDNVLDDLDLDITHDFVQEENKLVYQKRLIKIVVNK